MVMSSGSLTLDLEFSVASDRGLCLWIGPHSFYGLPLLFCSLINNSGGVYIHGRGSCFRRNASFKCNSAGGIVRCPSDRKEVAPEQHAAQGHCSEKPFDEQRSQS